MPFLAKVAKFHFDLGNVRRIRTVNLSDRSFDIPSRRLHGLFVLIDGVGLKANPNPVTSDITCHR
jgi:hypothetical protein